MSEQDDYAIVIAHWNGAQLLRACLNSVMHQTILPRHVIVVDNGSTDESITMIHQDFPDVHVIALSTNTGFAHANNIGIVEALRDERVQNILTLNNDAILNPNAVAEMIIMCKKHSHVGVIQGKIVRAHDHSILDCTGIVIAREWSARNRSQDERDYGQYAHEEEIFGASASAALYTRVALERTQLSKGEFFDECYFAYLEDVDLAWRLRYAGFRAYYTPRAVIEHVHSATGVSHSPFKAYHIHRNHYYNIVKLMPWTFFLQTIMFLPLRYCFLVASLLRRKGPSAELAKKTQYGGILTIVLRSWGEVLRNMSTLLAHRRVIQQTRVVKSRTIASWFRRYHARLRDIAFGINGL